MYSGPVGQSGDTGRVTYSGSAAYVGNALSRLERVVIRGGTIVDQTGTRPGEILVDGGIIVEVGQTVDATGAQVLDATGCFVTPGLVDMHVHLREPGNEEAETIETGSRAAALGGFTGVVAMPNTKPVCDDVSVVRLVQRFAMNALCEVQPAAAITMGLKGETITPMIELAQAGVKLFTDDGNCVQSSGLTRRAMEYSSMLNVTLASHCEDGTLARGGHMHEGEVSSLIGIQGQPVETEELIVMREIALATKTGAHMHLMHLSTAGSVAMVSAAKAQGAPVTAEVTPHHFTLTDEECASFDPRFKVAPPLRSRGHRDAIRQGIKDGVFDVIATDHAPHQSDRKELPFDQASVGMLGLETALALAITELELPIEKLLELMSFNPARIAGFGEEQGGPLIAGRCANIAVIDPDVEWIVDASKLASRAKNTPYFGRKLRGKVRHTMFRGEVVVRDGEATR